MAEDQEGLVGDLIGPVVPPLTLTTEGGRVCCVDARCPCRGVDQEIPLPLAWDLGQLASAIEAHQEQYGPPALTSEPVLYIGTWKCQ